MITDIAQHELEKKVQKAKEGFISLPLQATPFAFAERPMGRDEIIQSLQKGLEVFEEERRTRAAHEAAVEARKSAVPKLIAFHAEAMAVARSHFGSDAKKMATFEAPRPIRSKRRNRGCQGERGGQRTEGGEVVVTTVVEEVTTISEQASCEGNAPRCEEGTRKPRCRASRPPKRTAKPPCEGQRGCGSKLSRGAKGGRG